MAGKNLTALFFMLLEIAMVTAVCALLRMPLGVRRFAEAYSVAAVVMIFLFSAGNLLSIRQAKGVDPGNSIRTGAAGRLQALLFAIYPVTFAPILLAYLARYAFGSQAALFTILGLDAVVGLIVLPGGAGFGGAHGGSHAGVNDRSAINWRRPDRQLKKAAALSAGGGAIRNRRLPFEREQRLFGGQPAAEASERSVTCDHAVARDHDGQRVGAIGGAHGARGLGFPTRRASCP